MNSISELFDVYGLNGAVREFFDLKSCLKLKMMTKSKLAVWEEYEIVQVLHQGKLAVHKHKLRETCYLKFSDFNSFLNATRVVYELEILLEVLGIIFHK
jgi:hypothetical protein